MLGVVYLHIYLLQLHFDTYINCTCQYMHINKMLGTALHLVHIFHYNIQYWRCLACIIYTKILWVPILQYDLCIIKTVMLLLPPVVLLSAVTRCICIKKKTTYNLNVRTYKHFTILLYYQYMHVFVILYNFTYVPI